MSERRSFSEKENNFGGHCRPLERRIEANCCIAPARSSDDCAVARLRPLPLAGRSPPSFLLLKEEVGAVCERGCRSQGLIYIHFSHSHPSPVLSCSSFPSFSLIIQKKKGKERKRERETRQMFYFGEGATRAAGRMSGRGQLRKSGLFFFVEC